MNNEDELKRFLQDRFDKEEFPFDENDWKKAGAVLERQGKWPKLRVALVAMCVVMACVSLVLLWSTGRQTLLPANAPLAAQATDANIDQNKKSVSALRDARPYSRSSTRTVAPGPLPGNPTHTLHASSLAPGRPTIVRAGGNDKPKLESSSTHQDTTPKAAKEKNASQTGKRMASPAVLSSLSASAKRAEKKHELPAAIPALETRNEEAQRAPKRPDRPENEKASNDLAAAEIPGHLVNQTVDATPKNEAAVAARAVALTPESGTAGKTFIVDTTGKLSDKPFVDGIDAPDDTLISNNDADKEANRQHRAREGLCLEVGAGYLNGWKYSAGRDARGFTPVAGFSYYSAVDERSAISVGAQYMMVGGLLSAARTSRTTSFRFGEESEVTVITPATLHYLIIPLRYWYFDRSGNVFGTGVNIGYLLNVEARVETYEERPGYTGNVHTTRLAGYTEGFSWFDAQWSLLYQRRLWDRIGLQAELFLGLADVKNDAFFGQQSREHNSGMKLGLVFYASKKISP